MNGNWLPNTEQQLLLDAALLPATKAQHAFTEWANTYTFDKLDPAAFNLLPKIYLNLATQTITHPVFARFKGVYRSVWSRNQLMLQGLRDVLHKFSEAQIIDSLLLKGAAQILFYCSSVAERPIGDIDLMLRTEDMPSAMAILNKNGWQCITDQCDQFNARIASARHAIAFTHPMHELKALDLHWHVAPELMDEQFTQSLWNTRHSQMWQGLTISCLNREEFLLHTIIHGSKVSPSSLIRWIPDVTLLLKQPIDWEKFCKLAIDQQRNLICSQALNYLQQRNYAEIPEYVLQTLLNAPTTKHQLREHFWRSGRWSNYLIASASMIWYNHRRQQPQSNTLLCLVRFPHYLCCYWGLGRTYQLPYFIFEKFKKTLKAMSAQSA